MSRSSKYYSVNDVKTFSFWLKIYAHFFSISIEFNVLNLTFCFTAFLRLSFNSSVLLCRRVQIQWVSWPEETRMLWSFFVQLWWIMKLLIYSFYYDVKCNSLIFFVSFINLSVYSRRISSGWILTFFYLYFFFGLRWLLLLNSLDYLTLCCEDRISSFSLSSSFTFS